MKGNRYPNVEVFRQINWNGTSCYSLGQRRSENDENRCNIHVYC